MSGFHTGGHVALRWELRPWMSKADSWVGALTTWVEAGEQMLRLAAELDEYLPRPAGVQSRPEDRSRPRK